eukprot:6583981-Pyramimonas_sp.AAC.1
MASRARIDPELRRTRKAKALVLSQWASWVARIGPRMCDVDCEHVSRRQRKARGLGDADRPVPRLVVGPPLPVAPRSLSRADLASARVQLAEGRPHVMHPFAVIGDEGR